MYLKLALRNVRRCIRDYAIYFVTLLFGVATFYAFNSISSQQVLFDLRSSASARMFESTQQFLNMFSAVIVVVLAFLVLYANQFLIRRRKKEFGTYLVLGMSSGRVSRMVLYETVIVGCASLVLGLGVGILLSQGLSFVTALLFDLPMMHYQFIFSREGCITTLTCFACIYVIVTLLNTFTINRYKLIDLLHADETNQKIRLRNPYVCTVVFVLACAIIVFAYMRLAENGLVMLDDPAFAEATIAMLVGTLLFFWSLAGLAITLITHSKRMYLKGIRPFTLRQIASRVNTAFASLWVICVLLFFSITVFSGGMGMIDIFVGTIKEANPYSATLMADVWYGPDGSIASSSGDPRDRRAEMEAGAPDRLAQAESTSWNMADALKAANPDLWEQTVGACAQVTYYEVPDQTYGMLIDQAAKQLDDPDLDSLGLPDLESLAASLISVVSLSDYNAACELQGKEPLELAAGTCAIVNNLEMSDPLAQAFAQTEVSFTIGDTTYTCASPILDTQLEDNMLLASTALFVVPDEAIADLQSQGVIPDRQLLDIQYANNGLTDQENDEALAEIVATLQPADLGGFEKGRAGEGDAWASLLWPVTRIYTAYDFVIQSNGMRLMITYLALYIGLIFLVSTAAILAIQQLSQIADATKRYRILHQIGCDKRLINRSILTQILIYFCLPLGLALCHSACAIAVLSDSLFGAFGVSPLPSILVTLALVLAIYGGYLAITYLCAKNIVRTSLAER